MTKENNEERQRLCDRFVTAAQVSDDGNKIRVGEQEAEYKWRIVYGLKAQWEYSIPRTISPRSRFYPLEFDHDDRQGVIEYLAGKEADRVLEESSQSRKNNPPPGRP